MDGLDAFFSGTGTRILRLDTSRRYVEAFLPLPCQLELRYRVHREENIKPMFLQQNSLTAMRLCGTVRMTRGGPGSFHDVFHADTQVAEGHPRVASSSPHCDSSNWAAKRGSGPPSAHSVRSVPNRPTHTGHPPTRPADSEHSLRCRHHGEPGPRQHRTPPTSTVQIRPEAAHPALSEHTRRTPLVAWCYESSSPVQRPHPPLSPLPGQTSTHRPIPPCFL